MEGETVEFVEETELDLLRDISGHVLSLCERSDAHFEGLRRETETISMSLRKLSERVDPICERFEAHAVNLIAAVDLMPRWAIVGLLALILWRVW